MTGGFFLRPIFSPLYCWRSDRTLYVGFPVAKAFGVYDIDPATGVLTFKTQVAAGPGTCWIRTNSLGNRDFALGFSPDGAALYVVSQNVDTTFTANNNWLHVLKVAVDGTVSEPGDPLLLPVPNDVRPQGVATR